jgi:hypothetical protein
MAMCSGFLSAGGTNRKKKVVDCGLINATALKGYFPHQIEPQNKAAPQYLLAAFTQSRRRFLAAAWCLETTFGRMRKKCPAWLPTAQPARQDRIR